MQRKKLATYELMLVANEKKMAFALLQEPYVGGIRRMKDYRGVKIFQCTNNEDETIKAAIAVFNDEMDVIQYPEFTTTNIVVVKIRTSAWEIVVISFYFEPTEDIQPYLEQLRNIVRSVGQNKIIIGGDANAKSTWWGSTIVDDRGEEMAGTIEDMGLQVLNEGDTPTFDTVRGNKAYTSFIDLTACTAEMLALVEDWKVNVGLTSADHNAITFQLRLSKAKGINVSRTTRIYNSKKANWTQFHEKLGQLLKEHKINKTEIDKIKDNTELEQKIELYIRQITETCNISIPKKKLNEKLNLPWWSEELAKQKKEVTTKKRRVRCAAPIRREKVVKEYLQAKETYEENAKKAQIDSWKGFCEKQDKEGMWEGIYRVIGRATKRQEDLPLIKDGRVLDQKESAKLMAETFYPEDKVEDDNTDHQRTREKADQVNSLGHDEPHDPLFTLEELKAAVNGFNPKKAPGSDGLTADICKHAITQDPELYLSLANKCLIQGHFPDLWKEATVVALRKPGKDRYTDPKSYRPIGLLPVMGKILEKLVVGRIKWHTLPRLSIHQYGFMPRRSTEDALYVLIKHIRAKLIHKKLITMISLDIEGAFDSAWWPAIRVRLAEERCPINIRRIMDSYLQNRKVQVRYAGESHTKKTTKGCVQGSIGGPILWNLLLDPLLQGLERRGDYAQAFADDVVLVFDGDTAMEVQQRANAALAYVQEWGVRNKLKFAPHKTNAMILTRKLKHDTPLLDMGGIGINMSSEIRILGLTIDNKLTFNTHAANVCTKALNLYKQLARAARVSWGLHPEVIRVIYTAVVEPVIMYAASVWAPATEKQCIKKQLNVVQRGFAQKLCRAYRTVSLNAALVLAGILPLDLRIQEAAALYEAKRGALPPALVDREAERMAPERVHPVEHLDLEFICLEDQQQVDAYSNKAVRIFTDGSKIEGKVGAALSMWNSEAETKACKFKLSTYCTVYQAELLAICQATREILRSTEANFGIYSDSKSSLQTVTNNYSTHPLAVETRKNLRESKNQNKDVSLFWIKAHAGLQGNERADELAKDAALKTKKRPDYDQCPMSYVKRQIRLRTLEQWNQRYQTSQTGALTRLFLPDATDAYKLVRKIKPTGTLTQVMTGHGGFSEYLNRFKLKESPSCACEPGQNETVSHMLLDCPIYGKERYELEQNLNIALKLDMINKLIREKTTREDFINYCINIANKVIKRNKTDK